jgi:hypothetical protein
MVQESFSAQPTVFSLQISTFCFFPISSTHSLCLQILVSRLNSINHLPSVFLFWCLYYQEFCSFSPLHESRLLQTAFVTMTTGKRKQKETSNLSQIILMSNKIITSDIGVKYIVVSDWLISGFLARSTALVIWNYQCNRQIKPKFNI